MPEAIVINFVKEKVTKNTIRFKEAPKEGKPPVMGTLYVQIWALPKDCEKVTITLDAA